MVSAHHTDRDRVHDVDALRGLALLGILVVNMNVFASAYYGSGVADPQFVAPLDQAVSFGVSMLFELKFYLLFSFLFGYSFTLQMAAADRTGSALRPRILRRQLGLFLIGCAHGALLFHGDILTIYAGCGLILLAARATSDRRAIQTAAILIAITTLLSMLLATLILVGLASEELDVAAIHDHAAQVTAAYRGSPVSTLAQRVHDWPLTAVVLTTIQGPSAIAMFLVGLVAGRHGVLADPTSHRVQLDRVLRIGLPLGLAGAIVYACSAVFATNQAQTLLGLAVSFLTAPMLTGAYVVMALRLFARRPAVVAALAPAGRIAATNYLLQSLVCSLIFTGYGLAMIGSIAPAPRLLIVVTIFALQLALAAWWLRNHTYGPVEWLLRAITRWSIARS